MEVRIAFIHTIFCVLGQYSYTVCHTFFSTYRASCLNRLFGCLVSSKTIPQGAATTVYACVAPNVGLEIVSRAFCCVNHAYAQFVFTLTG